MKWDESVWDVVGHRDCYGLAKFKDSGIKSVVDVGANIGSFCKCCFDTFGPDVTIAAFEPSARNFAKLINNIKSPRFKRFLAAIGAELGETTLWEPLDTDFFQNETREGPHWGSCFVDGHTPYGVQSEAGWRDHYVKSGPIPVVTLDDLFPNGGIDLLKIDCEGSEVDVLIGAARLLPTIKIIVGEAHSYELANRVELQLVDTHRVDMWHTSGSLHQFEAILR